MVRTCLLQSTASSALGTWSLVVTPQHYDLADKDETQEDYDMEARVCKLIKKDAEEIWSSSGILEMPLMYLWRHIESVTNF